MARINQAAELPTGHIRVKIELTIEGPAAEAFEKLAGVLKALPRETPLEALAQIEERVRKIKAKEA